MPEMPDFIRKAIVAQGKYVPEEIEERLDEAGETLLGVVEGEPRVEEKQEPLDLGIQDGTEAPDE